MEITGRLIMTEGLINRNGSESVFTFKANPCRFHSHLSATILAGIMISVHRPQVEQKYGRICLWIHEKADTDIARAANKLSKQEFCWKDIAKLRFTAFRLKNARSYAEQTLKGQVAAEQNGSPWNCRRISYYHQLGREGELLKRGSNGHGKMNLEKRLGYLLSGPS